MSWTLLRKELREHGAVLIVACLVATVLLLGLLNTASQAGGRFAGLSRFSLLCGVLLPFLFANRLMVREYGGRTQLFLETLPIGRGRVFTTKWGLGCALTLITAGASWYAAFAFVRRTEVLPFDEVGATLFAFGTFWFTVWCFAAMAGMLGRYRYVAWALVLLLYVVYVSISGVSFFNAPVVRLLGDDVQMAHGLPDARVFATALAIAAVCFAVSAVLALAGSGSMATWLSRRMTARERVFALVGLSMIATLTIFVERKPEVPPFAITAGERVQGLHARVGVMPTTDLDEDRAMRLASRIASDLDALIEALGLNVQPSVFVLPQSGLDRDTMQRADVPDAEGIAMRIAANALYENVGAHIAHSLIVDATHGRALLEDRHVLLDGITVFWPVRNDEAGLERWRRRVAAVRGPIRPEMLLDWDATAEAFGECLSLAVAFSVYEALLALVGEDRTLALLRAVFETRYDDFRAALQPSPRTHLQAAGVDWELLAEHAEAARRKAGIAHAEALSQRPAITHRIDWRADAVRGIEIETELDGLAPYAVYYGRIGPWATGLGGLPRFDVREGRAVLPLAPTRGDRVLVALEIDDPVLDCDVRVAVERLELL